MECPECGNRLGSKARFCSCGWKIGDGSNNEKAMAYAICYTCQQELPWPTAKQPKDLHRIIGQTKNRSPWCNRCYEKSPEWDWRSEAIRDFQECHKDDQWGALIRMSYSLKGAPKEDQIDFMGMLKEQARKSGGVFGKLSYDKTKRQDLRGNESLVSD